MRVRAEGGGRGEGRGERAYGHAEAVGQSIHPRVSEQLLARVVDVRHERIRLQRARLVQLLGEVFARVEVLEQTSDGEDVVVGQVDALSLSESPRRSVGHHGGVN